MDLKSFLPKKDEKKEYFWSVVLEPGWVQAGIWRIEGDRAQVVLSSPAFAWELPEELISAVDDALSSAIQSFPEDIQEPTKTVFGVSSAWVKDGEINQEHLDKIKRLCSELSLKPIGFVVLPEAIAYYIKSEEGGPLTAIILGVYRQNLEISLFRLGSLVGTTTVSRSVSVIDDVIEGIVRFSSTDNLPSRFILYDGKEGEMEEVRQSLLKVNWEDYNNIKLLHTPKVEIVDSKTKVYSVCLAGASELGEVKGIDISVKTDVKPEPTEPIEDIRSEVEVSAQEIVMPEEMGFVEDKDVMEEMGSEPREGDVEPKQWSNEGITPEEEITPIHQNISRMPPPSARKVKFPTKMTFDIGKTANKLLLLLTGFKVPKMKFATSGKKVLLFGLGSILLVLIMGFAIWWFYPKAVVTVYVSPKRLDERFDLMVEKDRGSSSFGEKILSGREIEENLSGEKTKQTSGTKTIGDKAKGEVTIYRVGSEIVLNSGTSISGPDTLKFTLDEDVDVASGSAGTPGTTKVKVTASGIGAEYNLAGGSNFRVGNYSTIDMEAKNESSFSGGSSRDINAVSQDDQDALLDELQEELKGKAVQAFKDDLKAEDYLIEDAITTGVVSKKYSAKVGDEALSVKLSLDVKAKALIVAKDDLNQLANEILKEKIPQGFNLRSEQIDYDFDLDGNKDGKYDLNLKVSANLLPSVDTEDIVNKIKGKSPQVAEDYMNKEVPGFMRAEIRITPILPGKLKTLPHIGKMA